MSYHKKDIELNILDNIIFWKKVSLMDKILDSICGKGSNKRERNGKKYFYTNTF